FQGPGCAASRVTWGKVCGQRCATERHLFSVPKPFVDGVFFSARLDRLECRHILGHRHDLRSRQLLYNGIAFLMIAVCVGSKQDLDGGKLEAELLNRLLNGGNVSLVRAVDKNISSRRHDEKRTQCL